MITLEEVKTKNQKETVKSIIINHHSYVPTTKSVGRKIDWLIYKDDDSFFGKKCIGMIGIGSSVYPPPKDILNYLKLSKEEYKKTFNNISNNWRFCLIESDKNDGTQILKQLRTLAPVAWKSKYGDNLNHIITFVGAGKTGSVYKADNWKQIGHTSGLPSQRKAVSMKWNTTSELQQRFVKPTGENKKIIFIKMFKDKVLLDLL